MGLDMRLTASKYFGVTNGLEDSTLQTVTTEVAYWRKDNQIHSWFVENIQEGKDDCNSYYVSRDSLMKLIEKCKEIILDNSLAEKLLPTVSGFFFGSTDFNQSYFEALQFTVDKLEKALTLPNGWTFRYQSLW